MSSVRLLYNNPFTGETEKRLYFSKTTCFPNSKNRREKKKIKVSVILKPRASISPSATQPLPPAPLAKNKTVHYSNIFRCLQPRARFAALPSAQAQLEPLPAYCESALLNIAGNSSAKHPPCSRKRPLHFSPYQERRRRSRASPELQARLCQNCAEAAKRSPSSQLPAPLPGERVPRTISSANERRN